MRDRVFERTRPLHVFRDRQGFRKAPAVERETVSSRDFAPVFVCVIGRVSHEWKLLILEPTKSKPAVSLQKEQAYGSATASRIVEMRRERRLAELRIYLMLSQER